MGLGGCPGSKRRAGPGCSRSEVKKPGPVERRREARPGSGVFPFPWQHPNAGGRGDASAQRHIFYDPRGTSLGGTDSYVTRHPAKQPICT
jgi:hypothetical protein